MKPASCHRPFLACALSLLAAGSLWSQSAAEWMRRGDALDARNQTQQALAAYLEAEKAAPPSAALLHRMARQYGLSMNDEPDDAAKKAAGERALACARRSVAADPADPDAHVALAICHGRLARFQDTRTQIQYSRLIKESAEKALLLNPRHELACYVLASWHYELARLHPLQRGLAKMIYGTIPPASNAEAVKFFKQAIALNPSRMASYVDLGLTYVELSEKTAARLMLTKGLSLPDRERDDPQVRARAKKTLAEL